MIAKLCMVLIFIGVAVGVGCLIAAGKLLKSARS